MSGAVEAFFWVEKRGAPLGGWRWRGVRGGARDGGVGLGVFRYAARSVFSRLFFLRFLRFLGLLGMLGLGGGLGRDEFEVVQGGQGREAGAEDEVRIGAVFGFVACGEAEFALVRARADGFR